MCTEGGDPCLQVQDEQYARVRVLFETGDNPGYQFKTHPNIDKQLYNSNILGNKDADRPFPTGSALPILKWRMQVCHPAVMPLRAAQHLIALHLQECHASTWKRRGSIDEEWSSTMHARGSGRAPISMVQ